MHLRALGMAVLATWAIRIVYVVLSIRRLRRALEQRH